jgi:hypothetical protein
MCFEEESKGEVELAAKIYAAEITLIKSGLLNAFF